MLRYSFQVFVLKVKGHSGFFSCTRCQIEGEYLENRLCFPYNESITQPSLRTHDAYVQQTHEEYHNSSDVPCLSESPNFNIVSNFSLDYMHLVCLGAVKKIIIL